MLRRHAGRPSGWRGPIGTQSMMGVTDAKAAAIRVITEALNNPMGSGLLK